MTSPFTSTPLRPACCPRTCAGRRRVRTVRTSHRTRSETVEGSETIVRPGLIDLQVNGYAGHDVNADDVDVTTIAELTRALWAQGVTTYLHTVIIARQEKNMHVLAVIAAARSSVSMLDHTLAELHVYGP